MLIDFGSNNSFRGVNVPNPDPNGNFWNSLTPGPFYHGLDRHHQQRHDDRLWLRTPVGTDSFNGPAGVTTFPNPTPAEIAATDIDAAALGNLGVKEAAIDFAASPGGADNRTRFEIQQLDPTKTYNLTFFGSHKFSDDDTTVYSVYTDNTYTTLVGIGQPERADAGLAESAQSRHGGHDQRPCAAGEQHPVRAIRRRERRSGISERFADHGGSRAERAAAPGRRHRLVSGVPTTLGVSCVENITSICDQFFDYFDWLRWTPMNVIRCSMRRACLVPALALLVGQAVFAHAQTVLIDFGSDTSLFRGLSVNNPDSNGNYWNSMQPGLLVADWSTSTTRQRRSDSVGTRRWEPTATTVRPGPTDADDAGRPTCCSRTSTRCPGQLGGRVGRPVRLCGRIQRRSTHFPVRFQIQGLNPAATYDLTFFGSHSFSNDTTTVYTVYTDDTYTTSVASTMLDVQDPLDF